MRAESWDLEKTTLRHRKCEETWGKPHVGKVAVSRAVRRGELLRGEVSQRSPSPLKA